MKPFTERPKNEPKALLDYHNFIDKTILPVTSPTLSDLIKSQWETDLILLVFMTLRHRRNLGEFCVHSRFIATEIHKTERINRK